jgi:hypothetical protein
MKINNSFTYETFLEFTKNLLAKNKATGTDQSQEKLEASRINAQRFKRLNKTAKIKQELQSIVETHQPVQIHSYFCLSRQKHTRGNWFLGTETRKRIKLD